MRQRKKLLLHTIYMGICLIATGLLTGCSAERIVKYDGITTLMGTVVKAGIYTTEKRDTVTDAVFEQIKELENNQISKRIENSYVWQVNRDGNGEQGCVVSDQFADWIRTCVQIGEATEGYFDIALERLVGLWDIDGYLNSATDKPYELPSEETIHEALAYSDATKIRVEDRDDDTCAIYLPEGMQIDLGAVGKGIALDEVLDLLEKDEKITGAVISVGGSILTYGAKEDGTEWKIAITDPLQPDAMIGKLCLEGQWCISTSGDYERYVEVDGKRYHHILNPKTGYPGDNGTVGVTILSKNGLLSDALSTACFLLSPEEALQLADQYGVYCLLINSEGEISMNDGMEQYFSR